MNESVDMLLNLHKIITALMYFSNISYTEYTGIWVKHSNKTICTGISKSPQACQ